MKRAWTILSVLAIANLLAIGGFIGWLVMSDRLDNGRVQRVREMLAMTVAAENAAKSELAAKEEQEANDAAAAAKLAQPPVPAAQVIAVGQRQQDLDVQTTLRKQRELEDLRASLLRLQSNLEQRELALAQARLDFEETKKRYAAIEGAAQFQTALSTLEGQKSKDAKAVMQALLSAGQTEQVIAYLAKMDEGKRSKIVAEFVKDAPPVAADLLERLRTRGAGIEAQDQTKAHGAATTTSGGAGAGKVGGGPTPSPERADAAAPGAAG